MIGLDIGSLFIWCVLLADLASRSLAWKDGKFTCTAKAFGSCTGRRSCRRCMKMLCQKSRIAAFGCFFSFSLSLSLSLSLYVHTYLTQSYVTYVHFIEILCKNQWEGAVLSTFIPVYCQDGRFGGQEPKFPVHFHFLLVYTWGAAGAMFSTNLCQP